MILCRESGQGVERGPQLPRVYTHCLQEVPGQAIGTVVTCNGLHCDNVIPGGGEREEVGCGVGCDMGNIDNKVGAILISTKRFIVQNLSDVFTDHTQGYKFVKKYFLLLLLKSA